MLFVKNQERDYGIPVPNYAEENVSVNRNSKLNIKKAKKNNTLEWGVCANLSYNELDYDVVYGTYMRGIYKFII